MFLKHIKWMAGVLLGFAMLFFDIDRAPIFFVRVDGQTIYSKPLYEVQEFSLWFIHSVQKTPVRENLIAIPQGKERGMVLRSTKYQSFGVGLPFHAEEGDFRREGDYYIFDHMNRRFRELSLRVGAGTQLTLFVGDTVIPLHQKFPPGTKVDICMEAFCTKDRIEGSMYGE